MTDDERKSIMLRAMGKLWAITRDVDDQHDAFVAAWPIAMDALDALFGRT